nr:hypothetical protein GCM10020063_085380 [Dactylosporangium thailandense]
MTVDGEPGETAGSRRRPRALTVVALVAAAMFVLFGIGSPLLGTTVFAGTDGMAEKSPYLDAGYHAQATQNMYMDDIYTAELPATDLYAQTGADWNPYVAAGTPLGSTPNYALYSPMTLPRYVLPGWLAPAYIKLFEMAVAIAGCVLFLRLLGLRTPAAVLGGIVFASSAFMVMWTNWPQTRVAALIPWLFWGAERLVRYRRPSDAVPVAGALAGMLLAGFPSVTAYAMLTVGPYVLVRALALRRADGVGLVRPLVLFGGGVAGGVALSAVQLLPWLYFYQTWWIDGRAQTPADHLSPAYLVTMFAPWTFGSAGQPADAPRWYPADNMVEASSYLGAAALVLVVVAVAAARPARSLLPQGAWTFLVAAAAAWLAVIYTAVPLRLLVELPVFSANFVGRARSVLGFLLAVLAAVGFEVLLRRPAPEPAGRSRVGRWWGPAVVLGATAGVALLVVKARGVAATADGHYPGVSALPYADRQAVLGLVLIAAAVAAAALLRRTGGPAAPARGAAAIRLGAATAVFGLVAGQALSYVGPYWPRAPRETYYPVTDTHRFLAEHLGDDRYVGTGYAMFQGENSAYRLRSLSGHTFVDARLVALLNAMPHSALHAPTQVFADPTPEDAASPVLDRLGVRYLVASPRDRAFGAYRETGSDGSAYELRPEQPVTAPLPAGGPLRAVGVAPLSAPASDPGARLDVVIRDESGRVLAEARRLLAGLRAGEPFLVPVAGEGIASAPRPTVTMTLHAGAAVRVAGVAGLPATSVISPGSDGLALVYAGSSVVYERRTALPRIRWASSELVEPDRDRRVALLASGALPAGEVVLDRPGPGADGRGADVHPDIDGTDSIRVTVRAEGAGYLVVADAIQAGWAAWVDGRPAPLLPADQAVVAVAVPAGVHTVDLRYSSPYSGAGGWITLAAALAAAGLLLAGRWHRRGRRQSQREAVLR